MDTATIFRRLEDEDFDDLAPHEGFASEKEFGDALVSNPSILVNDLWLVGREIQTDAGRIDLLGVDPEGTLVVFELKLGKLSRGAVSQAIEYTAFLYDLELEDLISLITNSSGRKGISSISDFVNQYKRRIGQSLPEDNFVIQAVLVSEEIDEPSARSIDWLYQSGIPIGHLVLRASRSGGDVVFDVLENWAPPVRRWWYPPADAKRLELIDWIVAEAAKTEASNLHAEVLDAVATAFPSGRWEPRRDPGSLGLNWQIRGQTGKLVDSITIRITNYRPSQVWVMLFDEALQYAPRKLRDAVSELATAPGDRLGKPHGIAFFLSSEDWQKYGPALRDALAYAGAKHAKAVG